MNRTITLVVVKAAFGASLALGFAAAPHGVAHADTPTVTIEEDSVGPDGKSLWKCAEMGNRVCGERQPGRHGTWLLRRAWRAAPLGVVRPLANRSTQTPSALSGRGVLHYAGGGRRRCGRGGRPCPVDERV